MRNICIGAMFLASSWLVWGQQSLTITASRSIAVQPDEAVFAVTVTSRLGTGFNDVVAALTGSGITAANLVTVSSSTSQQNTPILQWTFNLPVPFSNIKNTITSLTAAQGTIGRNKSGLSLTFYVQGTQVSPQLQASQQCPIAGLIADAQSQAQNMAASSGVTVGPILALSDGSGAAGGAPVYSYSAVFYVPTLSSFLLSLLPAASPTNCTVVVKFSVLPAQ